jgi:cytochrome c
LLIFLEDVFMRKLLGLFVLAGFWGNPGLAFADNELLQKKNCLACHSVDKRKYGPNFKEVAAKYADEKDAVKKLAKKIKAGGTGVWGNDPMPAQPQVSKADAQVLAKYILSLK